MPNKIPIPQSINYYWNFRSLIRMIYTLQIISRIILSLRYFARSSIQSFDSVETIVRNVDIRYLFRGIHLIRSQAIILLIYLHICRSLYYRRRANILISLQRAVILVATIRAAFLRYVLPWRQISFWRATVITRFLGVLPIRPDILEWVWGGFSVGHPTLTRFFSLHYLLRILIGPLSLGHILLLHSNRSRRPLRDRNDYYIPFWPYFRIKDIWPGATVILLRTLLSGVILPETENMKHADPIVTPTHIKPEWYFLLFYAILRAVPSKTRRLLLIILSIVVLIVLLLFRKNYSLSFIRSLIFRLFISNCLLLRLLRRKPVEEPFLTSSVLSCLFFFFISSILVLV